MLQFWRSLNKKKIKMSANFISVYACITLSSFHIDNELYQYKNAG